MLLVCLPRWLTPTDLPNAKRPKEYASLRASEPYYQPSILGKMPCFLPWLTWMAMPLRRGLYWLRPWNAPN
jgi:hypothetical protein